MADGGDLSVTGGSLSFGDTLAQNEFALLMAQKGEFKLDPLLGVGIADMVGDADITGWKLRIRDAFKADGLNLTALELTVDGKITRLEARYD